MRFSRLRLWLAFVVVMAALVSACGGTRTVTHTVTVASPTLAEPGYANAHRPPSFGNAPPSYKVPGPAKTGPTVEQFDDVTISKLPSSSQYIGAYANGLYANVTAAHTAFPHAKILTISVTAFGVAQCLDIEPGDATPSEAAAFYRLARGAGIAKPCLYFPLTLSDAVNANLTSNGIARSSVWEWDAHWTGVSHIDPGFDGTQWTDHAFGLSLDESTLTDAFVGAVNEDPRHWSWLPNDRRTFTLISKDGRKSVVHAREGQAASNWDHAGCREPATGSCRVWASHMDLLDARIIYLAHHSPGRNHKLSKPAWGRVHYRATDGHVTTLGGAHQQLVRRESSKNHGVVTHW